MKKILTLWTIIVAEAATGIAIVAIGILHPDARYLLPGAILRMATMVVFTALGFGRRHWALWVVIIFETGTSLIFFALYLAIISGLLKGAKQSAAFILIPFGLFYLLLACLAAYGVKANSNQSFDMSNLDRKIP
jgi:hypothetical protein